MLNFTILFCTVLCCTVLYCAVLYSTVLNSTLLYCSVLFLTVLYFTVLTALHWLRAALSCTAQFCTVLLYSILNSTLCSVLTVLHRTFLYFTVVQFAVLHCTIFITDYTVPPISDSKVVRFVLVEWFMVVHIVNPHLDGLVHCSSFVTLKQSWNT